MTTFPRTLPAARRYVRHMLAALVAHNARDRRRIQRAATIALAEDGAAVRFRIDAPGWHREGPVPELARAEALELLAGRAEVRLPAPAREG